MTNSTHLLTSKEERPQSNPARGGITLRYRAASCLMPFAFHDMFMSAFSTASAGGAYMPFMYAPTDTGNISVTASNPWLVPAS
jgi:hypothetical protein